MESTRVRAESIKRERGLTGSFGGSVTFDEFHQVDGLARPAENGHDQDEDSHDFGETQGR